MTMPLGQAIGIFAVLAYGLIIPVAVLLPETKAVRSGSDADQRLDGHVCRLYRQKRDL